MPQLDTVSWLNQSLSVSLNFWVLFFGYYVLVLIKDSYIMKFDFKVISFREIFNTVYSKQKTYLYTENFLVWFTNFFFFFGLQKSIVTRQDANQSAYLKKFAPVIIKLKSQVYLAISVLH